MTVEISSQTFQLARNAYAPFYDSGYPSGDRTLGGETVPPGVLFFDDFDYTVTRAAAANDADGPVQFVNQGPWAAYKDWRTGQESAGGYLYTVDSVPGYDGPLPGGPGRTLCIECLAGSGLTGSPIRETDFYLQMFPEDGAEGALPADVWFQYWMFTNDNPAVSQESRFDNGSKWLYPSRVGYPVPVEEVAWLLSRSARSGEKGDASAWDTVNTNSGESYPVVYSDALVVNPFGDDPNNVGRNVSTQVIPPNQWVLVKVHLDLSGPQGAWEEWQRPMNGSWTKTAEWIGGVTPGFSWPLSANDNLGHKCLRFPTTMRWRDYGGGDIRGGDSWTYKRSFAMAGSEADLPTYSGY